MACRRSCHHHHLQAALFFQLQPSWFPVIWPSHSIFMYVPDVFWQLGGWLFFYSINCLVHLILDSTIKIACQLSLSTKHFWAKVLSWQLYGKSACHIWPPRYDVIDIEVSCNGHIFQSCILNQMVNGDHSIKPRLPIQILGKTWSRYLLISAP